jgi:hypothetical protein
MKTKVCLLQTHSSVNENLYQLTLPNHAEYAGRHGYDMVQLHRTYLEIWWGFEDYILALFEHYDKILTVGSDVIFTRPETPLHRLDDGCHGMFIQDEGIGYPTVNFDVVLWADREKCGQIISRLRARRGEYIQHAHGLQAGVNLLQHDTEVGSFIKVLPPRTMQSAPFLGYPEGAWQPGDFAIHFLGMCNEEKYLRARHFLETGDVLWRERT